MVVPHGDEVYYRQRPSLAIARPDDSRTESRLRAVDLDGFFGLHSALAPLFPLWEAGHLAIVQAVGSPDVSHSHFKAMELMERGIGHLDGPPSGWLGRHLSTLDHGNHSPLRGVSIGEKVARSLQGAVPTSALRSVADLRLAGDPQTADEMQSALVTLYSFGDPLDVLAGEAMRTLDAVAALDPGRHQPDNAALYPVSEFGLGLQQVATLIKAEVGLEVACLDLGGWDTHIAQGGSEGFMATLLGDLAQGLSAFYLDVTDRMDRLTVVVMSEFGRRLKENGGLGTDHGQGGIMLLLGPKVVGGRVHGHWPGLEPEQLVGPGDLAVTTDYRDVLAEIVARRLNNPRLEIVFPGHKPSFRNVVAT